MKINLINLRMKFNQSDELVDKSDNSAKKKLKNRVTGFSSKKDAPVKFDEKELKKKMKQFEVKLEIDMLVGKSELTGWGCDLSKEYVSINADYTT